MALKIFEKFSPRANPADADYPHGSIKNESVPGAKDGTPLDASWGNDMLGFTDALLVEAGIAPSGNPDTVIVSQRLDAVKKITSRYIWGDRYVGNFRDGFVYTNPKDVALGQDGKYYSYIGGGEYPVNVNAGTVPGDFESLYSVVTLENESVLLLDNMSQLVSEITDVAQLYYINCYHTNEDSGGGLFKYDTEISKSDHNGITVIDPDAPFPSDFDNDSQLTTWFNTSNTGAGCFVRLIEGDEVTASMAGFTPLHHSRVFLQEIMSKHASYNKISFADIGVYNLNSPVGVASLFTIDDVENLIIDIRSGVDFVITADCTDFFYDGFRFNNSKNVLIKGDGSVKVTLSGSPESIKEGQAILFIECENVKVEGIKSLVVYEASSTAENISAFNIRFRLCSDVGVEKVTFLEGNRGKCVQIGQTVSGYVRNCVYKSVGGLKSSFRDRAVRVLGECRDILVHDNSIVIAEDCYTITVFEVTSGAGTSDIIYARDVKYSDNEVVMRSRDDDSNVKGVRLFDLIGCSYIYGSGNTFWCPANKPGVDDQFMAVNLKAINGRMPSHINLIDNTFQSKYSYVIDQTITEQPVGLNISNRILQEHSFSGQISNPNGYTFNSPLIGELNVNDGILSSGATFEKDVDYTKLASGDVIVAFRRINFSFNGNIGVDSVTDIILPLPLATGFCSVSVCYGGPLDLNGRNIAKLINDHLLIGGGFNDMFQISTDNQELADAVFTFNYTVNGRWY